MKRNTGNKVLWTELLPHEFKKRLAEWLYEEEAGRAGGIVAPSMGYHIHETGCLARWLEEQVGEENPHMKNFMEGQRGK